MRLLFEHTYPVARYPTRSAQQQAFARDAGVSWSSVQRKLEPESGFTLDLVADIAVALRIEPHHLLDPNLPQTLPLPRPEGGAEAPAFRRRRAG
ncbi:MAG TPA: hypothetical protein VFX20_18285 [Steroidobacteraceae bacterium]|nr:hypothetical protein [Steroidobacteraceae bacterium]